MLRKISVNHDYLGQSRKYTYLAQSHVTRMVFYWEEIFNICLTYALVIFQFKYH